MHNARIMHKVCILVHNITVCTGTYGNVLFVKWTMTMMK